MKKPNLPTKVVDMTKENKLTMTFNRLDPEKVIVQAKELGLKIISYAYLKKDCGCAVGVSYLYKLKQDGEDWEAARDSDNLFDVNMRSLLGLSSNYDLGISIGLMHTDESDYAEPDFYKNEEYVAGYKDGHRVAMLAIEAGILKYS